ncbi:MAG: OmpA family protein [Micrococcales bacterium]|nr:OmpA family protein [Micrococcales bacterium]
MIWTRTTPVACGLGLMLVVVGCTSDPDDHPVPCTSPCTPSTGVLGFPEGEVPPVPLFTLPDLSLLSAQDDAFTIRFADIADKYPGLTVSPAACDDDGTRITSDGAILAYGDGSTSYTGPDGTTVVNYGDGSGTYQGPDGTAIVNHGNGSGTYHGADGTAVVNDGGGTGSYSSPDGTELKIYGNGAGWYRGPDGTEITNYGDGSGTYQGADGTEIVNHGDGTGSYRGPDGTAIVNDGAGTATVTDSRGTRKVPADPLPGVPPLGQFPPLEALTPQESCGVSITVDAGLLFDFGDHRLRPEAQPVIATVAQALRDNAVPVATVEGHTDAVGGDDLNQRLSENRASTVADALRSAGVTTDLDVRGYGKTRPVAPDTNPDGSDNPAGRQLNRRVEIFVRAF